MEILGSFSGFFGTFRTIFRTSGSPTHQKNTPKLHFRAKSDVFDDLQRIYGSFWSFTVLFDCFSIVFGHFRGHLTCFDDFPIFWMVSRHTRVLATLCRVFWAI